MAGRKVVRDKRGRFAKVRHPCTVGKAKAKATGPGKVNATATKKAAVKTARTAATRKKASASAHKTAARTAKARTAAAKTTAKTSGRVKAAARPC